VVKGHKDLNDYTITVRSDENAVIVLKYDEKWKGEPKRVWPPPGIDFTKVRK
jgi:hypothetical protein